jgi:hypothetical protein
MISLADGELIDDRVTASAATAVLRRGES